MGRTNTSIDLMNPPLEGSCFETLSLEKQMAQRCLPQQGLRVSHYLDYGNAVKIAETSDHFLCCLVNETPVHQMTQIGSQKHSGSVKKGDVCIKPAAESGFWSWEETNNALIFGISHDFLRQIAAEDDLLDPDKVELLPVIKQNDSQISHLAALFQQGLDANALGNLMYLESLGNVLGVHLLRNYCAFSAREAKMENELPAYKMRRIIDFIDSHMADEISLSELAKEVKLSQSHFSTLFRAKTGQSPHQFLIQKRLERAQDLLLKTDMKIADIAIKVGFCDQSHLSRHMKKKLGLSPRKIREHRL